MWPIIGFIVYLILLINAPVFVLTITGFVIIAALVFFEISESKNKNEGAIS